MHAKSLQLCPTLCDPMDWSSPGCSIHGALQERILEGVAISFSIGSSWPRDQTCISCGSWIIVDSLPLSHQGSPMQLQNQRKCSTALFLVSNFELQEEIFQASEMQTDSKNMSERWQRQKTWMSENWVQSSDVPLAPCGQFIWNIYTGIKSYNNKHIKHLWVMVALEFYWIEVALIKWT